jgi:hypothetical protein
MTEELGFDVEEFMLMKPPQRAQLCAKLAERAQALAAAAAPQHQRHYLVIAHEWLQLANEMMSVKE